VLDPGDDDGGTVCRIETARAYRDRLVLKLEGIDDANAAAALRGRTVAVAEDEVPELPEGRYWLDHLLGLEVVDERAGSLGRVEDVIETGGGEVLVVRPMDGEDGEEILIPLVRRYVRGIEEEDGTIRTDVPEDLLDLNRGG
jgi:16S rRNA processing protein RimM